MFNKDVPSTATFIPQVMAASHCKKHRAAVDKPCYKILDKQGVCNARAKRAGYNAPISEKSMRNKVGSAEARRKDR